MAPKETRGNSSGIVNMVRAVARDVSERVDGWVNVTTGLGTSRDKTKGGYFAPDCYLSDPELRSLFNFDDIAAKVVETYPQEEMRLGFGLKGLDAENCEQVDRYLKKFALVDTVLAARIWGGLFGGSAIWMMVEDGKDPSEELDLTAIRTVLGLRVIERPWLIADQFYPDGAKVGMPMIYRIQEPHPGGAATTIGYIHETRLVIFPGARTDSQTKILLRGWDLSVLQKPYAALKQTGETWAAINLLITDANQGVYKVSQLFDKIAGDTSQGEPTMQDATGGGAFLKRVQIMDRVKSVFRALVLDKDEEEYERLGAPSFSGLADLSDRGWRRVASAADLPVPLLQGENPAGLNNSGTMQLQWFWAKASQKRTQIDEPRILTVLRVLLSAKDAPEIETDAKDADASSEGVDINPLDRIGIVWPDLWAPTAAELATMRLQRAQEAQVWVAMGAMLPEEALLSTPAEWFPAVDREMREEILEEDRENMLLAQNEAKKAGLEQQTNPDDGEDPEDPEADPKAEKDPKASSRSDWNENQPRAANGEFGTGGARLAAAHARLTEAKQKLVTAKQGPLHAAITKDVEQHREGLKRQAEHNQKLAGQLSDKAAELKQKSKDTLAQAHAEPDEHKRAQIVARSEGYSAGAKRAAADAKAASRSAETLQKEAAKDHTETVNREIARAEKTGEGVRADKILHQPAFDHNHAEAELHSGGYEHEADKAEHAVIRAAVIKTGTGGEKLEASHAAADKAEADYLREYTVAETRNENNGLVNSSQAEDRYNSMKPATANLSKLENNVKVHEREVARRMKGMK